MNKSLDLTLDQLVNLLSGCEDASLALVQVVNQYPEIINARRCKFGMMKDYLEEL